MPLPAILAAMIIDNTSETLPKVAVDLGDAAVPDLAIPDISSEPARSQPRCDP